jgi:hypothetical protein
MTSPYLADIVAGGHDNDLRRQARHFRLAALATCCQPGTWARTLRRATGAAARLHSARRRGTGRAAPCCGPA